MIGPCLIRIFHIRFSYGTSMTEYINFSVLVIISLLRIAAVVMIIGSPLKKNWATDGERTSLSIYYIRWL